MPDSSNDNRRFLTRLWMPVIAVCVILAVLVIAALTSGDNARVVPVIVAIVVTAVMIPGMRWWQKRRFARMFRSPDPNPFLQSFAASARRVPNGSQIAAANACTVLALYGRFREADDALRSVSWAETPPIVNAQASAARAVLAYAQGVIADGLDHAVAAMQEASVDGAFPGAAQSELAFRMYRNLGLALSGRETEKTAEELRQAKARLPLLGQILAAWGLAAIARRSGDTAVLNEMRAFIEQRAPYFAPVLESLAAA
jgi:hypothetical protein